jgi:hypothetical protein
VYHGERLKMVPQTSPRGVDLFRCGNGHERRERYR